MTTGNRSQHLPSFCMEDRKNNGSEVRNGNIFLKKQLLLKGCFFYSANALIKEISSGEFRKYDKTIKNRL